MADADDAAEMIEHDLELRQRARRGGQLRDLSVVQHRVVGETLRGDGRQPSAIARLGEQAGRRGAEDDPVSSA